MQSVNLLLLILCSQKKVLASELFDEERDPVEVWRRHAQLWYSQCSREAWTGVIAEIGVSRLRTRAGWDLELALFWEATWQAEKADPMWEADAFLTPSLARLGCITLPPT